jgi:signal transduction histidine kinase
VYPPATGGPPSTRASGDAKASFLRLLDRNVQALHRLLEDVTGLARLQGGHEHRSVAEMDASLVLRELCDGMEAIARERGLFVATDGPPSFVVRGDSTKIRRIVQNLLLNAINYTRQGGVSVSWGASGPDDSDRWYVQIADTGPGFHGGPGARLAGALESATDQARAVGTDAASGDVTHVDVSETTHPIARADPRPVHQQAGEGIGLSIVKRLCTLLDATIEMDSAVDEGTTFRILIPKRYDEA